ncbi:MAG: ATP-binding cassette domain-containing protein [Pseudonocardiaceae bacterium]|nr:ATP-binding cassette domain-containing protein [Pseudonocardiaceae bacterium]
MLTVTDLTVRYGRAVHALQGVSLEVPDGAVVAVLGGNGAGKSTLLRAISGTLRLHRGTIDAGEITLQGRRIDQLDPATIVRSGVVQVPEGRQVFAQMTVADNLRAGGLAAAPERRAPARERVLDLFPVLAQRRGQRAGLLSGGEQQMLSIGRALMSDPKLLLLDEPSLGLAPRLVTRIGEIVAEINDQGTAVVLVEQNATMALRVAGHAAVLEVGRVALAGTTEQFADSDEIARLYLGGHAESEEQARVEADRAATSRRTLSRWSG